MKKEKFEQERLEQERRDLVDQTRKLSTRTELDKINKQKKTQKEEEITQQRAVDMELLQRALMQDKESKQEEALAKVCFISVGVDIMKARTREEALRYKLQLEEQMKKQAENESYLDQLKQQESDETWKKRTNQWQKEEEARNKLAKEVYEERNRQMQMKCMF